MNKTFSKDNLTQYLQWNFILKEMSHASDKNITLVDYGCNNGELLETLYRNRRKVKKYIGLDVETTPCTEHLGSCKFAEWISDDINNPKTDLTQFKADKVCSLGNLGRIKDIDAFLVNFKNCGAPGSLYYLTSGTEYSLNDLKEILSKYFDIVTVFGTEVDLENCEFNDWQQKMYDKLSEYYPDEVLAVVMAPFFTEISKNKMWILKRK